MVGVQRLLAHIAVTLVALLCVAAPVGAQTFTVFDVPGSNLTFPEAISPSGMVAGSYRDATGTVHGFIRDEQGQITTFDLPAAVGIVVSGFGQAGSLFGYYYEDPNFTFVHGFIRERDGTITTFDVPGAIRTVPRDSNAAGQIVGTWGNSETGGGFVRERDGTFSWLFESGSFASINNRGDIVGILFDVGPLIRDRNGDITTFQVNDRPTAVASINDAGTIVGHYITGGQRLEPLHFHGFLLDKNGRITIFEVPITVGGCQVGQVDCQDFNAFFLTPTKINASGWVIGTFSISSTGRHATGFLRDPSGNITRFSTDTILEDINARGEVTGHYPTSLGTQGFIFNPRSDPAK